MGEKRGERETHLEIMSRSVTGFASKSKEYRIWSDLRGDSVLSTEEVFETYVFYRGPCRVTPMCL